MDTATTVSVVLSGSDFTADGLTDAHDYVLPTGASGTGTITPLTLTATIAAQTKPYDGGTTGVSTVATLAGLVSPDSFTVGAKTAQYNSKDVDTATTVSVVLSGSDFTAVGATDAHDYVLPTGASGTGTITPLTLTATIAAQTKPYDGGTTGVSTVATLAGLVSPDSFTVGARRRSTTARTWTRRRR